MEGRTFSHHSDLSASYWDTTIENFQTFWEKNDYNLKKQMLRALLAALTVQGDALTGWTPNSAFYPLLKHALPREGRACHYGSDGT
jgi:hypothetical protein